MQWLYEKEARILNKALSELTCVQRPCEIRLYRSSAATYWLRWNVVGTFFKFSKRCLVQTKFKKK